MYGELTYKKVFKFWTPLAATWLMMSIEGPFLAAIIARMIDPKFNLAAYGVAYSFALIIEAPVIMMLSASVALVKNKQSFYKLRSFIYSINGIITFIMLLLLIPPVFDFFAVKLINLPQHVADITYYATFVLLPWPGAIGYRRFYQGILIRHNSTRKVAYGTIVRLVTMGVTATILYLYSKLDGAIVGSFALSAGVVFEALASRIMVHSTVKKIICESSDENNCALTFTEIIKFYYPLALTSIISLGVHPMVTFFIGQSRMPLESLAVLQVLNSLVFIFRSLGLSYQEVSIALMGDKHNYKILKNFAAVMAISVVIALGLIAFTPLSDLWFVNVSGLSSELAVFAEIPLMLYVLIPATTVLINTQRGILVHYKNTKPITGATFIEVSGILIVLFILIKFFSAVGVVAAVVGYTIGRLAAVIYLFPHYFKTLKEKLIG